MGNRIEDSKRLEMVEAYQDGELAASICERFGVSKGFLYPLLKEFGVKAKGKKLDDAQSAQLVADYQGGIPINDLAASYKVSGGTVRNILRAAGAMAPSEIKRRFGLIPMSERENCAGLYGQGLSLVQVATELSLPPTRVRNALLAHGIKLKPMVKYHKLSKEQQVELCRLYAKGKTYGQLADDFGISPDTVGKYLKRNGVTPRAGWASYRVKVWTDRRGREFRFKSSWELAYAQYLDDQGISWDYEAAKFPLPKSRCYTPDFWIMCDGEVVQLVEVKGWLDDKQVNRMLEFAARYPSEAAKLQVLGPAELAKLGLIEGKYKNHHMAAAVAGLREQLEKELGSTK